MSEEDEELLVGVARGDPDVWERIYRAYAKDVHATAQKELRSLTELVDSKDVQDIVQQTFLEAMEGGVLTPDTKSISAKLRTVAARRARDAHRRGSRVAEQAIEDIPGADSGLDPIEELIESGYRREIAQAVWRNHRRLDRRERQIVQAFALGETFTEIGHRMGLTGQRIGQIYKEAAKKLVAGIDPTGDGGGRGA